MKELINQKLREQLTLNQAQNIYKKWDDYSINLGGDMIQSINNYVPSKK